VQVRARWRETTSAEDQCAEFFAEAFSADASLLSSLRKTKKTLPTWVLLPIRDQTI
jgi:hypothetical protein